MLHRLKLTIYDVLVDVEIEKTFERRLAITLMISDRCEWPGGDA